MLEITALVCRFRVKPADSLFGVVVVAGALLFAGEVALSVPQLAFRLSIPPRIRDLVSGRKSGERLQADVDPDLSIGNGMQRPSALDAVGGEDGVPLPGLLLEGNGLDFALDGAVKRPLTDSGCPSACHTSCRLRRVPRRHKAFPLRRPRSRRTQRRSET